MSDRCPGPGQDHYAPAGRSDGYGLDAVIGAVVWLGAGQAPGLRACLGEVDLVAPRFGVFGA
jgi:hypothetical protein